MSMNIYRNAHHRVAHKFKVEYAKVIRLELNKFDITKMRKVVLEYHLYFKPTAKGKAKRIDLMNIGSMIDKVVSDELTNIGFTDDDSIEHIAKVTFFAHPYSSSDYCKVVIRGE